MGLSLFEKKHILGEGVRGGEGERYLKAMELSMELFLVCEWRGRGISLCGKNAIEFPQNGLVLLSFYNSIWIVWQVFRSVPVCFCLSVSSFLPYFLIEIYNFFSGGEMGFSYFVFHLHYPLSWYHLIIFLRLISLSFSLSSPVWTASLLC